MNSQRVEANEASHGAAELWRGVVRRGVRTALGLVEAGGVSLPAILLAVNARDIETFNKIPTPYGALSGIQGGAEIATLEALTFLTLPIFDVLFIGERWGILPNLREQLKKVRNGTPK